MYFGLFFASWYFDICANEMFQLSWLEKVEKENSSKSFNSTNLAQIFTLIWPSVVYLWGGGGGGGGIYKVL